MSPEVLQKALDALESGDATAIAEALKAVLAASTAAPAAPAGDDALAGSADPTPPDPNAPAEKAALSALVKLTGAAGIGDAVARLTAMSATVAKLQAESEALEAVQRRELVGELVRLRCEDPSTAWEGKPEDQEPAAHLAAEPLASLRGRVEKLRARRPAEGAHTPPTSVDSDGLTSEEAKLTASFTPAQKAAYVALRASRKVAS